MDTEMVRRFQAPLTEFEERDVQEVIIFLKANSRYYGAKLIRDLYASYKELECVYKGLCK